MVKKVVKKAAPKKVVKKVAPKKVVKKAAPKKVVNKAAKKPTKNTVAQRLNSAVLTEKNWAYQAFKAFGELGAFSGK